MGWSLTELGSVGAFITDNTEVEETDLQGLQCAWRWDSLREKQTQESRDRPVSTYLQTTHQIYKNMFILSIKKNQHDANIPKVERSTHILILNFPIEPLLAGFWEQNWQFIKCSHASSINFTLHQSSCWALKENYPFGMKRTNHVWDSFIWRPLISPLLKTRRIMNNYT